MVIDQTSNFVRQDVISSVGTNDPETIDVNNASDFPDPASGRGQYNAVLWDTNQGRPDQDGSVEVVRITGRDAESNTVTASRGQEGTSNTSHPSTSALLVGPTGKVFDDIEAAFDNFWDEESNELTADVNNSSTQTNSLTIGNGNTVSGGPVGDSGEWIPLVSYKPAQDWNSTTSTSYTRVENNSQSVFIPKNFISSISNIVDVGMSWAGYVKNDTSGTNTYVSYGYDFDRFGGTEEVLNGTGPWKMVSSIASLSGYGDARTNVYMKVSGGQGSLESNHTVTIWGKIR